MLEKNFTRSSFVARNGGKLGDADANGGRKQPDPDRLLYKRKPLSGSEFAGIGAQFGVTIVVFALAGIWLDRRLGTSPWLLIVLVLGGSALAFWSMYRRVMRASGPRTGA